MKTPRAGDLTPEYFKPDSALSDVFGLRLSPAKSFRARRGFQMTDLAQGFSTPAAHDNH